MIYLDANCIIYGVEGDEAQRQRVLERIRVPDVIATSQLSRLECRVKPLRSGDVKLLATYDEMFSQRMRVLDITDQVIDRATDLRARFGFKTPDAIHVASAIMASADRFLTADKQLTRCPDLIVELL